MRFLQTLNNGVARVEAIALAICLLTMLFVAFFQVVMRNIYDVGYVWADILVRILVLWVGLLGAAVATSEARHLTIDVITKFMPPRVAQSIRVMTWVFALTICTLLARASMLYMEMEKQGGEQSIFGVPTYLTEIIIPIAFVLISFHFFLLILQGIVEVFHPTESPDRIQQDVP